MPTEQYQYRIRDGGAAHFGQWIEAGWTPNDVKSHLVTDVACLAIRYSDGSVIQWRRNEEA